MDEVKRQTLALGPIYHRHIAVLHISQPDKPHKRPAVSPRPGRRNVGYTEGRNCQKMGHHEGACPVGAKSATGGKQSLASIVLRLPPIRLGSG